MTPRRPPLRYHGGKFRVANRIIEHFPAHRIYVEPFCGGCGILMRKERSFAEVINDLDKEVVNVFRVMRNPESAQTLRHLIELTPWSREDFRAAYEPSPDPVEQARRTIVKGFMAYGTTARRLNRTGFRGKACRQNQTGPADWRNYPEQIAFFCDRLRGVTIENRDALEIIEQQNSRDTFYFLDPPYVHSTRSSLEHKGGDAGYAHEMTDDDHRRLAERMHAVDGMYIISGYPSELYDELYADCQRVSFRARADGAVLREECLWISPAAQERGRPLFSTRDVALSVPAE